MDLYSRPICYTLLGTLSQNNMKVWTQNTLLNYKLKPVVLPKYVADGISKLDLGSFLVVLG